MNSIDDEIDIPDDITDEPARIQFQRGWIRCEIKHIEAELARSARVAKYCFIIAIVCAIFSTFLAILDVRTPKPAATPEASAK